MRKLIYLLIAIALAIPAISFAVTGDNARFDFTSGQPTITDDTSSTCNNQAVVRYDFTTGQPTEVYDTTATCNVSAPNVVDSSTMETEGQVIIRGQIIIQ